MGPRLMPLLMLTTDTTAVDTVTDMLDTVVTTVDTTDIPDMLMVDTVTSARGPLMPNPRLMPLLMLTTDTTAVDTVMDTVTDMVSDTVVTTDTEDTDMVVMAVTTVRLSKSYLPFLQPFPQLPTHTQFHKIVFNIMIEKKMFSIFMLKRELSRLTIDLY